MIKPSQKVSYFYMSRHTFFYDCLLFVPVFFIDTSYPICTIFIFLVFLFLIRFFHFSSFV